MLFDKQKIIQEVKEELIKELMIDKAFKNDMRTALGIKEDVIVLNGTDIKIEVIKKDGK